MATIRAPSAFAVLMPSIASAIELVFTRLNGGADAELAEFNDRRAEAIPDVPDAALKQSLRCALTGETVGRVGVIPVRADADGIDKTIGRFRRQFSAYDNREAGRDESGAGNFEHSLR